MKKLLLCGIAVSVALSVSAQNRIGHAPKVSDKSLYSKSIELNKKAIAIDDYAPLRPVSIPSKHVANHSSFRSSASLDVTVVGGTYYDLQSNRGPARRLINHNDGTLSAVWTYSNQQTGFSDRGTGYNYYDGTAWGTLPTSRVEPVRTGFTNIAVGGGNEYTLTHDGNYGILMKRTKGTGSWTQMPVVGDSVKVVLNDPNGSDVWFRLAVGGPTGNTVHAIVNSQGSGTTPVLGQNGPLTYSRSLDGGLTWDQKHIQLPGSDVTFYSGVSAENYSIDCNGSTVAVGLSNSMMDLVLWKSTDDGTTWTKTVIQAAVIPDYNTGDQAALISDADGDLVADTIESNGEDVNVVVDQNGLVHMTWSRMRFFDDNSSSSQLPSYFPGESGILYWNENMTAPVIAADVVDQNGDGTISLAAGDPNYFPFGLYGASGITGHPQLGFDQNNNIFLVYTTAAELSDTSSGFTRRHAFITYSTDNGTTWASPEDLVPYAAQGGDGEFEEAAWPSIAKFNGTSISVLYQRDGFPEHTLAAATSPYTALNSGVNDIIFVSWTNPVGIKEVTSASSFSMSQNYPNPFNGNTRFDINLKNNSDVTVEVYNVIGKLVSTKNYNLNAGSNVVTIDANGLTAGLYTYTVKVGADKLTRTMMVK